MEQWMTLLIAGVTGLAVIAQAFFAWRLLVVSKGQKQIAKTQNNIIENINKFGNIRSMLDKYSDLSDDRESFMISTR